MTDDEDVRKIIGNLRIVKDYGEFPKGQNYLFSRYKHEGLVFMGNKKQIGTGKNARSYLTSQSKVKLTRKGYDILKTIGRE
jgi:hypothetical protein